jgi:hypothetical protein
MLFQSSIGLWQFFSQRQLIGFPFFGEPTLTRDIGIAHADFSWLDTLMGTTLGYRFLPYGTTPHPNVLAGFLTIGLIVMTRYVMKQKSIQRFEKVVFGFGFLFVLITLFLTQSVSAWLSLTIGLTLLFFFKYFEHILEIPQMKIWLTLMIGMIVFFVPILLAETTSITHTTNPSFTRRVHLNLIAVKTITTHPLFGVGLNQFSTVAESASNSSEIVRFVQPAHHLPLLFVAENGALGIVIAILFGMVIKKSGPFQVAMFWGLCLLPIMTLDHYLYSLVAGQLIWVLSWL